MVSVYDKSLSTDDFQLLIDTGYLIMEASNISITDFFLFRQEETGYFMMTQITNIVENAGLKDGYKLVFLKTLN